MHLLFTKLSRFCFVITSALLLWGLRPSLRNERNTDVGAICAKTSCLNSFFGIFLFPVCSTQVGRWLSNHPFGNFLRVASATVIAYPYVTPSDWWGSLFGGEKTEASFRKAQCHSLSFTPMLTVWVEHGTGMFAHPWTVIVIAQARLSAAVVVQVLSQCAEQIGVVIAWNWSSTEKKRQETRN